MSDGGVPTDSSGDGRRHQAALKDIGTDGTEEQFYRVMGKTSVRHRMKVHDGGFEMVRNAYHSGEGLGKDFVTAHCPSALVLIFGIVPDSRPTMECNGVRGVTLKGPRGRATPGVLSLCPPGITRGASRPGIVRATVHKDGHHSHGEDRCFLLRCYQNAVAHRKGPSSKGPGSVLFQGGAGPGLEEQLDQVVRLGVDAADVNPRWRAIEVVARPDGASLASATVRHVFGASARRPRRVRGCG